MERKIKKMTLPDGTTIGVEVVQMGRKEERSIGTKILNFSEVFSSLKTISSEIKNLLPTTSANKTTVEFGVEVGVESNGIMSLVMTGSATASIKVTLEWDSKNSNAE